MIASMQRISIPAGQHVISAGATPGPFFIIEAGCLAVLVDGDQIGMLHSTDSFGEIGVLLTDKASADVVAIEPCSIFAILRPRLLQLLAKSPLLYAKLHAQGEERMRRASALPSRA
eukprot:CAMPEP_0180226240 /NCGR_PEP_ID=MMETSP0987-20121128/23305_1 /TAXON_ID=697907 /ORGANISM="non described non described, Strain CCMP2293" /LENGTH=115 /DNA_ID=CAMNT_0022189715 /DNA_START=21 /DNA_END=365 /DNA_ORIENTATION=+